MAKKAKKSRKQSSKAATKNQKRPVIKTSASKKVASKKVASRKVAAKSPAKVAPKPTGAALVSVSPSFTANDAEASIKWYCDVLGFKVVERWDTDGFKGAQLRLDDVVFNIGQDDWKLGQNRVKGQGTRMYITTGPDIDAYAGAIKARGGVLASEPTSEWGMRAFSVNDPDGFKLTFMTMLPK
jgi:catechol 2,3-dioxygenase-like lactoylglutathione lyase family enzyme